MLCRCTLLTTSEDKVPVSVAAALVAGEAKMIVLLRDVLQPALPSTMLQAFLMRADSQQSTVELLVLHLQ